MPRRPRINRALVELLEQMLEGAKGGEVTDVFVVARLGDGTHDHYFMSDDIEDLLYQAGGEIIRARSAARAIYDAADRPQ